MRIKLNRKARREQAKKKRRYASKFFTQPYKNGRTVERAREYYFPSTKEATA